MSRNFVLLGSVDNGKSTLGGRIKVVTGNISEDELEKFKNEANKRGLPSWYLAFILDSEESERETGKTHSYVTAEFQWKDIPLKMIDVPGHKDLISEMVTGASYADIALLVVSARKGEYEASLKGQIMEHILIARGLGISSIIIAINKMDSVDWNMTIYDHIKNDMTKRMEKFRFKNVVFVPISAYQGINISSEDNKPDVIKDYPNLLDTITSIPYIPVKYNLLNIKGKKIIEAKFMFENIPTLITSGFRAMLHTKDRIHEVEIVEVTNGMFKFITESNNNHKLIDVKLEFLDNQVDEMYTNFIIRHSNKTIGIGIVTTK
jgi:translation elongation factor EF-1alpha